MSSSISEDEKLCQRIRDYIELGSTVKTDSCFLNPSSQPLQLDDDNTIYFSLQEIMEETPDAETEVYGRILLYLKEIEESLLSSSMSMDKLKKWIMFRLEMDKYDACLCRTTWSTPFGPPLVLQFRGDYEYVEVMMRGRGRSKSKEAMRIIVDLDFRTQFELARPTEAYRELTNELPLIFVGSDEKLEKVISLFCSAAKQSLKEKGLHIPPWRKVGYMHSKWLSNNCKRVSFAELNLQQQSAFL